MANDFKAFMNAPKIAAAEMTYVASPRYTDEKGKPVEWRFRPISAAANEALYTDCTHKFIGPTGKQETKVDFEEYQARLLATCMTYPSLNNAELKAHFGAIGAEDLIKKMLLPGEYTNLFKAVSQALGFENDMEDKIKEAKN